MLVLGFPDFGVIWLLAHAFPSPTPISMLRPSGRSHPRAFGANIELGGQTYNHNMQTTTRKHPVRRTHTFRTTAKHTDRQTGRYHVGRQCPRQLLSL